MANFNYDFKGSSRNTKRQNELRNRTLRLTVLFCIVAVITAIVIFAIIPSGKDNTDTPPTPTAVTPQTETGVKNDKTQSGNGQEIAGNTKTEVKPQPQPQLQHTTPPERIGSTDSAAEQKLRNILNSGDFKAFFKLADELIAPTPINSELRAGLGEILTEGRKKAWQSGKWKSCAVLYRAVPGDSLTKIASKQKTSIPMVRLGNGLKNDNISIGQRLYLVPGPWKLIISRKAKLLTVLQQDKVFAVLKFESNTKKPLPAGEYIIRKRVKSPTFIDRHGRHFANGTAENMLGDAAIYLRKKNAGSNFGFHGISPRNRSVNNNFIQMRNDDILMLYHLLPNLTPVKVAD